MSTESQTQTGLLSKVLPRVVRERIDSFRRDIATVTGGFLGHGPPPLLRSNKSSPTRKAATLSGISPRNMEIVRVIRETASATTLVLRDPTGAPFKFSPGQFVTVFFRVNGENHRRAYSICTDFADTQSFAITIKRIKDGIVSNAISDRVREGDYLQILGPSGNFTVIPEQQRSKTYVLIAGGSGITPVMAITKAVLNTEPRSKVALVFGNTSVEETIFRGELQRISELHPTRFVLRSVVENPHPDHNGTVGQLTKDVLAQELASVYQSLGVTVSECEYFLCGPTGMMNGSREYLLAQGVLAQAIHEERFHSLGSKSIPTVAEQDRAIEFEVQATGEHKTVTAKPNQTILEAGLEAGLPMKFSCTMGGCGACKVKVKDGSVVMEEPNCLDHDERSQSMVLACISRPTKKTTVEIKP